VTKDELVSSFELHHFLFHKGVITEHDVILFYLMKIRIIMNFLLINGNRFAITANYVILHPCLLK